MIHPRKELFKAIKERLKLQENKPVWIDYWRNQTAEKKVPFNYPACFVSVSIGGYEDMTVNQKVGNATIDVRFVFEKFQDTFEGSEDQEQSLELMDQVELWAESLHFLEGETFEEITQVADVDITEQIGKPAFLVQFTSVVHKIINPPTNVFRAPRT